MVSTRHAERMHKAAEESPPPADSGDEYEEPSPEPNRTRVTKRARTGAATAKDKQQEKRSAKAKLWMLPEMPIDVLYEIFSLVHPRDLLHISWTASTLNGFLTSKSSRHVWQASFKTIPESEQAPPCPSEITEMEYANLLYGRRCMNCAGYRSLTSHWTVLMRICRPCVEEIAINLDEARPDALASKVIRYIGEVLPTFYIKQKNRPVEMVLISDKARLIEELTAAGRISEQDVLKKYQLRVRERKQFSNSMSRLMSKLERDVEKAKEDARVDIQKRRIEQIWEKLSEDGWREELEARKSSYESGVLKFKGVIMARPLGDKAWEELRDPLNKFMERESQRIHSQLDARRHSSRVARVGKVVESFRLSLPHPCDFSPSTADVCWIPEVRKAIVSGTDEEFQKCETELQSRIPELSAIWLEERRKFFLGLLPQDSPSLKHLALATTLFDCTRCYRTGSGMRIEAALSHACLGYGYGTSHEAEFPSATKAKSFHQAAGTPWDSGFSSYRYAVELPALAREVVLECGEDPDVMTTQEMNNKFHRFACFCRDGAVNVLTWSKVLEHRNSYNHKEEPCRLLRPDELPEYIPCLDSGNNWGCLHCWKAGGSAWHDKLFGAIKDHLAESHQITNPTEEDYYHKSPNQTVIFKYRLP